MRAILALIRKEYLQVFRDRPTVFQIFFIPVVQLLVLSNAATFEVKHARMHVVDLDRTSTSRGLVEHLAASGRFTVVSQVPSMRVADAHLLDRTARVILHIPPGFERDLVRDHAAPVQFVVNAEEGAAAGIVQSYALRIVAEYARALGGAASATVVPAIDVQSRGWFNPSLNYKHYMVPALLVSLTTIIGMLLTAQNIAREKELGTLEQLNVTPLTRSQFIAGKLLPFWILALVVFSIGLVVGRLVFDIPLRGSLAIVYLAAAVYLVAALGIGLWISTVSATQQQTQFLSFFVMMIYLLMSGLFTPIDAMPRWAQWLAELNPMKHFVVIMRAVLVRGAGLEDVAAPIGILAVYGTVVLAAAVRLHAKRAA